MHFLLNLFLSLSSPCATTAWGLPSASGHLMKGKWRHTHTGWKTLRCRETNSTTCTSKWSPDLAMQAPNLPESNPFSISSLLKSTPSDKKDADMQHVCSSATSVTSSVSNNFTNNSSLSDFSSASLSAMASLHPYSVPANLHLTKKDNFVPNWHSSFLSMLPQENNFFDVYQSLFRHGDHAKLSSSTTPSIVDPISIKYNLLKKCNFLLSDSNLSKCKIKPVTGAPLSSDLFHIRGKISILITFNQSSRRVLNCPLQNCLTV